MNQENRQTLSLDLLYKNRGSKDFTPPAEWYKGKFLWDSCFHAVVYSRLGDPDSGSQEVLSLMRGMHDHNGFVPGMHFENGQRWWDPEKLTFMKEHPGSDYTQPPLLALATREIYDSYNKAGKEADGKKFLERMYSENNGGNLQSFYDYFEQNRQNGDGNKLIGNIHPHETGRDSDPTFDFVKKRIKKNSRLTAKVNTVLDAASFVALNVKLRMKNWDLAKIKDIFWTNDLMFNSMYVDNLREMAKIGKILEKELDVLKYESLANDVEEEILSTMWNEQDQQFYNKTPTGETKVVSINNLFPLVLENIPENQCSRLLDLLEDPEWFNTPYPIPSVPTNSPNFDPHFFEKRLWRGPVWLNTNWYLVERGLKKQKERFAITQPILAARCEILIRRIAKKSEEMIEKSGYREFYDPYTAKGYRVKNFGWSTLGNAFSEETKNPLHI